MGLPLTPAPLPRAAARFAIAGLGGGGSCVGSARRARLASKCAAIFSLRDCGGGGGGSGGAVGVVSGKGGRASRMDCRLRTARSMDGSRPELASASRYISKASSEWTRGEEGFCGDGGRDGAGQEGTYVFGGVLPAVDDGVVALAGACGDQGAEERELLGEVVRVGVGACFEGGDLGRGVEGRKGRGGAAEGGRREA